MRECVNEWVGGGPSGEEKEGGKSFLETNKQTKSETSNTVEVASSL